MYVLTPEVARLEPPESRPDIEVWCDGSAYEGAGGWAAVLRAGGLVREFSGEARGYATSGKMELVAVIEGLRRIRRQGDRRVVVYSDSAYVVNCFRDGWLGLWKERGWITSGGSPVKHPELWEQLELLVAKTGAEFVHVKGHAGDPLNERADVLAGEARKRRAARWS